MAGSQFFINPLNALGFPPHFGGIAQVVNPVGPPTLVMFGHNGSSPFAQQIFPSAIASSGHGHGRGYTYQYVTVIVLTKNASGMYEILLPTTSHSIHLNCRSVTHGTDPDTLIHHMIDEYGLTHFGKTTMLRHIDHSSGDTYKIAVLYAPRVCRARINQHYQSRHQRSPSLHRFILPVHKVNSLRDNYGSNKSIDFVSSNIIYAIANVRHTLV